MSLILIFIIGLVVGSFLNVVIDRLPSGKSIIRGRSKCDWCQHTLFWYDLIPVLSFIWLKRKCRYCHKKISWQYPVVELTTGILFAYSYSSTPGEPLRVTPGVSLPLFYLVETIFLLIMVSGLIAIFFTDLKYRIIPDQVLVFMAISTFVFLFVFNKNQFLDHLIAGIIFFIVFISLVLVTKGRGMGLGDVKYAAVSGFILGIPASIVSFYLSFLTGAVVSLILVMWGKKKMEDTIPFGPFLVSGTLVSLFYGQQLWVVFKKIIGL